MSESIRVDGRFEASLSNVVGVGVDLAKRVIQVHAVNRVGKLVVARSLPRVRFEAWCSWLPAGSTVAMESCSGAHHWGRRLRLKGLQVHLVASHFVGAYCMQGKRGKNDTIDAAAICEASSRPHLRFVPVKSAEQQAMLSVHRLREDWNEERTGCINRIRGLLAEFGLDIMVARSTRQWLVSRIVDCAPRVRRATYGWPGQPQEQDTSHG